jgi:uncharacterized protein (TIRG00374 family)
LTSPDAAAPAKTRRILVGIAGAVLSILLLVWALRGVHLAEVVHHIREANPWPLLVGVVLASITFPIRLFRWLLLLRDENGGPLKPWPLWHATAIGFMANNLLPFRAGELVRIIAATRLTGARFTTTLSSVAIERVFDGLANGVLLALGLLTSGLPHSIVVGGVPLAHAARAMGLVMVAALLCAGAVVAFPLMAERVVRIVLPTGPFAERIVGMIEGLRAGFAVLRSPARLAGVIAWSLALWAVNALALWISFAAFDIPVDFSGALVLQGVLVVGVTVQLAPGFVGQFEAAIVAALALYGIGNEIASSYAIAYHGATFVPIVLAGAWSLARTPIQLSDLRRVTPS